MHQFALLKNENFDPRAVYQIYWMRRARGYDCRRHRGRRTAFCSVRGDDPCGGGCGPLMDSASIRREYDVGVL